MWSTTALALQTGLTRSSADNELFGLPGRTKAWVPIEWTVGGKREQKANGQHDLMNASKEGSSASAVLYLLDPDALGRLSTELAEQWYAWSLIWPPWISMVVLPSTGPPPWPLLYFIRDGVLSADFVPPLPSANDWLPLDVLAFGESFSFIDGLPMSGDCEWKRGTRDQSLWLP